MLPPRRLRVIAGDSLPARLPWRRVVLARDGDENWCVGFRCPCGCRRRIELLLIEEAKPHWTLLSHVADPVTLSPSVWLAEGCRSHFFLRDGQIRWCE
ncbi:DUF6527 family protein [Paraburkholderia graminis]|uniref:DUF6527 family protein n=1 Tax=Paraburkholderia graminis TaxID=60548 RepID=UPI0038B81BA6